METLDCIKKRRSCRKYLDKKVPDEVVLKLIDAARHAPFGGPPIKNCQLWEFVIVKSKETKQKLALNYDDRKFVASAPVVIAVCADKTKDKDYKDYEKTCSLAVQNILLTATDLGLGACYVSSFSHHEKHKEDKEHSKGEFITFCAVVDGAGHDRTGGAANHVNHTYHAVDSPVGRQAEVNVGKNGHGGQPAAKT